jgi:glycolate oxidase
VHHVWKWRRCCPDGTLTRIGSRLADEPGRRLGLLVGSEGTLAVVTKVVVRILRRPETVQTLLAAYDTISAAGTAGVEIIAAGIIPAAGRDDGRAAHQGGRSAVHPNFPAADTILIVELDGPVPEVRELFATVERSAAAPARRRSKWRPTKRTPAHLEGAQGRVRGDGRVSPNYYVQDGVVPRTKLPEVLGRIKALSERSGLGIGNVFTRATATCTRSSATTNRCRGRPSSRRKSPGEILTYCVEAGGSITASTASARTRRTTCRACSPTTTSTPSSRCATLWNPQRLCNPGKVLPTPRLCGEVPGPYREHPAERAGWPNASDGRRPVETRHSRRSGRRCDPSARGRADERRRLRGGPRPRRPPTRSPLSLRQPAPRAGWGRPVDAVDLVLSTKSLAIFWCIATVISR